MDKIKEKDIILDVKKNRLSYAFLNDFFWSFFVSLVLVAVGTVCLLVVGNDIKQLKLFSIAALSMGLFIFCLTTPVIIKRLATFNKTKYYILEDKLVVYDSKHDSVARQIFFDDLKECKSSRGFFDYLFKTGSLVFCSNYEKIKYSGVYDYDHIKTKMNAIIERVNAERKNNEIICSYCGSVLTGKETVCKNCGANVLNQQKTEKKIKKSNSNVQQFSISANFDKFLYVTHGGGLFVAIVVMLLFMAIIIYLWLAVLGVVLKNAFEIINNFEGITFGCTITGIYFYIFAGMLKKTKEDSVDIKKLKCNATNEKVTLSGHKKRSKDFTVLVSDIKSIEIKQPIFSKFTKTASIELRTEKDNFVIKYAKNALEIFEKLKESI